MYQLSTIDSGVNLFPLKEAKKKHSSALNSKDEAFYNSIQARLDRLNVEPPADLVDNILSYSRSL
jgi:hypothetical protein